MKPWPSPGISSIESDRSDMARTAVHHAMSELAHSEIPVHCEIAAITYLVRWLLRICYSGPIQLPLN